MTPFILSTWSFGPVGSVPAYRMLRFGGSALDAVVAGASAVELDASIKSVGLGGRPDADGNVSLDACVMTDPDHCGSVACLRRHASAAAIARRVMEKTIHVMLVGDGADEFADREGFPATTLLTEEVRTQWEEWRARYRPDPRAPFYGWQPPANVEEHDRPQRPPQTPDNADKTEDDDAPAAGRAKPQSAGDHNPPATGDPAHPPSDTVCYLARDREGRIAGACTTSGMAYKMPGRVGDSPIIGHGLYVDQQAGAAAATGHGELIMGVCGSFLVVEMMRQGASPAEACRAALQRVVDRYTLRPDHQVAFIAMAPVSRGGTWASAALRPGFVHVATDEAGPRVEPVQMVLMK